MDKIEPEKDSVVLSVDRIIDIVRDFRNAIIKGFLIDDNLLPYFREQYKKELSNVKKEFLKRDLKELLISPVDLVHYSSLINEIKEANVAGVVSKKEDLFYSELDTIFRKYCY